MKKAKKKRQKSYPTKHRVVIMKVPEHVFLELKEKAKAANSTLSAYLRWTGLHYRLEEWEEIPQGLKSESAQTK